MNSSKYLYRLWENLLGQGFIISKATLNDGNKFFSRSFSYEISKSIIF